MPDHSPRERIVYATAQSIRERGVAATSLRDVVERAAAPRGSLQHYFPGGKEQLVTEAIGWSAGYAASAATRFAAENPTPSGLFAAMARQWQDEFGRRGYGRGCPLLAATADIAADDATLRSAVTDGFDTWLEPVRTALRRMGVAAPRARSLALVMISALEGAIVLARARGDVLPLTVVVRELGSVLDAAVTR